MKRIICILLVLLMLLLLGCNVSIETKDNNTSNDTSTSDIDAISKVQEITTNQIEAINMEDIDSYIKTLDNSKIEYVAERKSWFRDLVNNDIKNYEIEVISADRVSDNQIEAHLRQSYSFNKKDYILKYNMKYIKIDGIWLDSDLNFDTLETENFIINYPNGNKKTAELAAIGAEEAYESITEKIGDKPQDKTVIKLYDDKELLRQFVKLSFAWQFAGWYEYPESIKSMLYDSKEHYKEVIEHELTHKITIGVANNNIPYWFAEGLAKYYTEYHDKSIKSLDTIDLKDYWNIQELELLNLETMTDSKDISNYYSSAGLMTQFIAEEYGREKLIELVEALGEYPYVEGTGSEVDSISIERLRVVMPKVLGVTVEEVDNKWIEMLN